MNDQNTTQNTNEDNAIIPWLAKTISLAVLQSTRRERHIRIKGG
jgi:hypothetical protein